jgi:FKBP-type peptidyl-prolyl cis-trans isomerase
MKHLFVFALTVLFAGSYALAQCDQCPSDPGMKPDYCYTDAGFAGRCVQFSAASDICFYFPSAKAKSPLKVKVISEISQATLAETAKGNPSLDGMDMAFLVGSFLKWKSAKMDIGFTFLPSGLGYKVIQEGTGKLPESGKKVKVHYKGYLPDGTKFDSSFDRNEPIEITLGVGQVIKGWDEGIGLFKVGSKGVLKIPANLGYGSRGVGSIPANATLFFDIEVVSAE